MITHVLHNRCNDIKIGRFESDNVCHNCKFFVCARESIVCFNN